MADPIDTRLREPEVIERELGYHLVRLTEKEIEANPVARPRCSDCVFRLGTVPNTTGKTSALIPMRGSKARTNE